MSNSTTQTTGKKSCHRCSRTANLLSLPTWNASVRAGLAPAYAPTCPRCWNALDDKASA